MDDADDGSELEDVPEQATCAAKFLHSATHTAETLAASILPGLAVGLLHGRMGAGEKDEAMAAFREGATDVLVSTTVVEVGVDVPNATVMVVLDADRFGLATLHQLVDLACDADLVEWAHEDARALAEADPALTRAQDRPLALEARDRFRGYFEELERA